MPIEYCFAHREVIVASTLRVVYHGVVRAQVGGYLLTNPVAICRHNHRNIRIAEACAGKAMYALREDKPLPSGWLSTTTVPATQEV